MKTRVNSPTLLLFTLVCFLTMIPDFLFAGGLLQRSPRPLQAESSLSDLDSWETSIDHFFIRSHHGVPLGVPAIDEKEYTLRIDGLVERPLTLRLEDIAQEPQVSLHAVLECSGNGRGLHDPKVPGVQWEKGAVGNAEWTGAALAEILKKAGVKPTARFARIEGADKPALSTVPAFIRSIPVEKLMQKDTLLALKMNREAMPLLHGGPLRLVLPRWYGHNWIKWVTRITLTEKEDEGFYMKKAYRMPKKMVRPGESWDSATGNSIEALRVQSFITTPPEGTQIAPGKIIVKGKAFTGTGTIAKVEISLNGLKHWQNAQLESPRPSGGWQEFQTVLEIKKIGNVTVHSRATDTVGNTQSVKQEWNPPGYLYNTVDRVSFQIRNIASTAIGAGLVTEKCLVCHARELIESQRLTAPLWEKVVKKMESFGAKITEEERSTLISYLAHFSSNLAPVLPTKTNYDREAFMISTQLTPKGNRATGAELYSTHCANCHGNDAEGKTGPRLAKRDIPIDLFSATVLKGSGSMPSFGESLKQDEVEAIRSFLIQPQ